MFIEIRIRLTHGLCTIYRYRAISTKCAYTCYHGYTVVVVTVYSNRFQLADALNAQVITFYGIRYCKCVEHIGNALYTVTLFMYQSV